MLFSVVIIIFMFWFGTGLFGWLGFLVAFVVTFGFLFGERIEQESTLCDEIIDTFITRK